MPLPLLGFAGIARAGAAFIPPVTKFTGQNGGEIRDLITNFLKKDDNKDNLSGTNGKPGVIKGFSDLMKGLVDDQKNGILDLLKGAMGMDDKAFGAFSKLFKEGNFSGIPADQLFSAGKFLFNMVS